MSAPSQPKRPPGAGTDPDTARGATVTEPTVVAADGRGGALRRFRGAAMNYLGVGSVLLVLVVLLTVTQDSFLTYGNLINILETNSTLLVVSVGLTFVLLVGGFDLSVGGMLALSGVMLAMLVAAGIPEPVAIIAVISGAVALGALANGFMIAKVGIAFIVITLGTASLFRGAALVLTGGSSATLYDYDWIRGVGAGRVAGVPWPVVIALAVLVLGILVVRYTGYGRMVMAIGGNEEAARLAGINTTAVRLSVYAVAAGCAALAGVLESGRLAAATPTVGGTIALDAGAAVLLGGTSFYGGQGSVFGTLLGVLFIGVLRNGLTLLGVSAFWTDVVSGAVLIAAVTIDRFRLRSR